MVERVALILSVFEKSCDALTFDEIRSRSGLPRSSAHRIVQQLVNAGLLERHANEYTLGLRMFQMTAHPHGVADHH
jgi:DNA-binding IclR family transcriptional regulator